MQNNQKENLKQLLSTFMNPEQAESAAKDIAEGEQILCDYPAAKPDEKLVSTLKTEINARLQYRKANSLKQITYKAVAVAAIFMVLAALSIKIFKSNDITSPQPLKQLLISSQIWESSNLAQDDPELELLNAETAQIQNQLITLQLGENGGNGDLDITELETELIEIDSDFWKG